MRKKPLKLLLFKALYLARAHHVVIQHNATMVKSNMNPNVLSRGRPFGCHVILWRYNLRFKVVPVETC